MGSRVPASCLPVNASAGTLPCARWILVAAIACLPLPAVAQWQIKPAEPGDEVRLMPSDLTILEAGEPRKDLPCNVVERKPDIGFDMRFHSGYEVSVPLRELAGEGELLTVVFRVSAQDDAAHPAYFVQRYSVPPIDADAKGQANLQGTVDLGEGRYHVDWLMRDRHERICSTSWDVNAALPPKDRPMPLFMGPNQVAETVPEPFVNDVAAAGDDRPDSIEVKLLVNFAPQNAESPTLQRSDTDALVSILKAIQRDPRVSRVSLVAFNMEETRVVYRQGPAARIDFPALGNALHTMKLGTVDVAHLGRPHSQRDFLEELIQKEIGASARPDAVIFAGPKAMLDADVPQDDLRRIGEIECPVFYMNYNLSPQAVPWKDSISHAIRVFKGTEYTISRPRDLWFSTSEMLNRIERSKRQHAMNTVPTGASQ